MKTLEVQLSEATAKIAALEAEKDKLVADNKALVEAQEAAQRASVKAEISRLLAESKLPEVAQKAVSKQFEGASKLDGVAEAIAAQQEYVKELAGALPKKNGAANGGPQESDGKAAKARLVESYMRNFGVPKEQAEQMAE